MIHALVIAFAITGTDGDGLIRAMRPGGDAPLEAKSTPHVSDHAAFALQRKTVFDFHIAWRMTASFLATATRAFLKPTFFASLSTQAFASKRRYFW